MITTNLSNLAFSDDCKFSNVKIKSKGSETKGKKDELDNSHKNDKLQPQINDGTSKLNYD